MEYPHPPAQPAAVQPTAPVSGVSASQHDPDEINLLEYIYALVKHKKLIIVLTLFGLVSGYVAALIKGPTWVAEAVIAPKETESQKTPSFAGLGAFGGMVASQLNLGGSASLEKIDLILDSREFGAKLIEKYSLLPDIYKYQWPKIYQKYWNSAQNNWNPKFLPPKPLEMGSMIKGKYLKKILNKNHTMTIQIKSKDSAFSIKLANNYIEYLNYFIKSGVQTDAKENVRYLETQLDSIGDPLLREKIQGLIADQIEKEMVVSTEAFSVVDPVYPYRNYKQEKLFPLVFSVLMFFISCLIVIFIQGFSSSNKTENDLMLIDKIKKEMISFVKN